MTNKSFIKINKGFEFVSVSELKDCTIFDSFAEANDFVQNHISKKIRYKYKVVSCENILLDDDFLTDIIIEDVTSRTINLIEAKINILSNALSLMDKKQQDILHNIELIEKFNLYESWKLINKLKTIRIKRRHIKKCLTTLINFKSTFNLERLYQHQCESSSYSNKVIEDFTNYIINEKDLPKQ